MLIPRNINLHFTYLNNSHPTHLILNNFSPIQTYQNPAISIESINKKLEKREAETEPQESEPLHWLRSSATSSSHFRGNPLENQWLIGHAFLPQKTPQLLSNCQLYFNKQGGPTEPNSTHLNIHQQLNTCEGIHPSGFRFCSIWPSVHLEFPAISLSA